MAQAANAVTCSAGGVHELVYQGRRSRMYRCNKCGDSIAKQDLKDATDGGKIYA